MLVGRTSYPRLSSLRHLAEITLPGCYELTYKFTNAGEIVRWVETNTNSDPHSMSTLDIMVKFVVGLDRERYREQEVRYALLSNLIWFTEATLPYYYLKIGEVREVLKRNIRKMLSDLGANVYKMDDLVYDELLDSFAQHVRENSCNGQYNPDNGGNLTGFLVFTLKNHWGPNKSEEIFKVINSRGMFSEVQGEDFSAMDMHGVSMDIKVDLMEFQDIASSIYKCSREIYIHGNAIIYDLFSRIKAKRGRELMDHLNDEISKYDNEKYIGKIPFRDINNWNSDKHEIRNKYTNRDEILSYVDPLLQDAASVETLSEIINTVIYVAEDQLSTKSKDAFSIFSLSSDKKNYDKVFSIIAATTKLRKLLFYLDEQKINIFSVPSAIFRDPKYQNHNIKTLRQYLDWIEIAPEILNETPASDPTDNTRIFGDLVEKAALNRASAVPLSGLRAILDASKDKAVMPTAKVEESESKAHRYLENVLKYLSSAMFYHEKMNNRPLRILSDLPNYLPNVINNITTDANDTFFENAKGVRLMLVYLASITCFEFALEQGKCLRVNSDGTCIIEPEYWKSSLDALMPANFSPAVLRLLEVQSFDQLDVLREEGRKKIIEILRVKQTIHLAFMQVISMASLCLYANRGNWSDINLFKVLTREIIASGTGSGSIAEYNFPNFVVISENPKADWGVDRGDRTLVLDFLKLPADPKTLVQILPIDRHSVCLTPSEHSVFQLFEKSSRYPLMCRQTNIIFRLASGEALTDYLDKIFENYQAVTKIFEPLFEIAGRYVEKFENIATSMSCSDYDIQEIPESCLEMAQIIAAVYEAPQRPGSDNRRVNKYGFYLDGGVMRPDRETSRVGVSLYKHASGHYFYFQDGKAKLWLI